MPVQVVFSLIMAHAILQNATTAMYVSTPLLVWRLLKIFGKARQKNLALKVKKMLARNRVYP
jgi:hypothetical protein